MAVLQWNPESGAYELRTAEVTTLEDLHALRGEAATPIGNAEIIIEGGRLANVETEKQFRDAVLENAGGRVEAQFIDSGGVLYPADFHSLNLATTYFNFEQSRKYLLQRGLEPDKLHGVPFYYFPDVRLFGSEQARQVDNAAWFPLLRSFVLYPFDALQDIPLAMNQGVIAHEYAHGLFNAEVLGESWIPRYLAMWCTDASCAEERGLRMIGILEEGFADAWAIGVTGDPRFTRRSLYYLGDARDPSPTHPAADRYCYSQARFEKHIDEGRDLAPADRDQDWGERQYEIGTMVAATLYRAGRNDEGVWEQARYDRVMDALLASYRRTGDRSLAALVSADDTGAAFGQFAAIARAVIEGAGDDTEIRNALCAAWMDRFAIPAEELGPLCDGVTAYTDCPK